MAHADVIVDQVNVDPVNGQQSPVSGGPLVSQRVSPIGGTRVSVPCKRKRKRDRVIGPKVLLGSSRSWACWAGPGPFLLLFLFLFLLFPLRLTPWSHLSVSPGSRAASSRSGANSSACVHGCVLCVLDMLATPRTRRRGVGVAVFPGNGGSAWCLSRQGSSRGCWHAHASTG